MTARFTIGVTDAAGAGPEQRTRCLRSIERQRTAHREVVLLGCNPHDPFHRAASAGSGDFVAVIETVDWLEPHALEAVSQTLAQRPAADIVYTDERIEGTADVEYLKPDWSPTRARSHDYCGQLVLLRRQLICELGASASRHELLLRAAERARRIEHVPSLAFHRGRLAETPIRRQPSIASTRSASIVIPTAGTARPVWGVTRPLVLGAVDSVLAVTTPTPQIVVVVDPSTPGDVRRALARRPVRLVDGHAPFNFAEACNVGVASCDTDDVVLLNDDTLVEEPGWLAAMQSFLTEPDVGVVGARLLYSDGTLQHGGILLNEQPLHIFNGYGGDDPGPFDLLRVPREVSAVTGACLATPRALWDELGGLDPAFAIAFNDVDYCLRVRRTGRRIIWTPDATLYHFESQSRQRAAAAHEIALLYERWRHELHNDPYGNPGFEPRQAEWISRKPLALEQLIWRAGRRLLRRPGPSPG